MPDIGGFSFRVGADVSAALAAFQRLQQSAQQSAQQVQAAFRSANVSVNTQQAQQAVQQLGQQVRAVQQGSSTVTIRAEVNDATQAIGRLSETARALGNTRLALTVRADGSREAERSIASVAEALQRARAGERITVQVRADGAEQADAAIRRLTADVERARTAGARVAINVATTGAQQGGFGQQAAGGFIQGITPGLSTAPAIAAGVVAAQGVSAVTRAIQDGIAAGVRYNAMLETAAVQFRVFTGSAATAEESLRRLRRFADVTPFNTEEVIRSGAVFAQVSGGSIERMERLVNLAGQLAAINPNPALGGGLEGATVAIREALGGDFTSARERFNISAQDIQRIRDAGLAGTALAEALVKAAGGSEQLLDALGSTFEGRLSTAQSKLTDLAAVASKPLFDVMSDSLGRFIAFLDQNQSKMERYVRILGQMAAAGQINPASPTSIGFAFGAAAEQARAAPEAPAPELPGFERERQAAINAANNALDEATAKVNEQKQALKTIEDQLTRNAAAASAVNQRYAQALFVLDEQSRALAAQERAAAATQRAIADRAARAQAPVAVRAQAAFDTTILDHEQEILSIRHRRAELAEQVGAAERAVANDIAEAEIRGQERSLQATQQRARQESEARSEALDGLREEIRGRQEARQAALEGLRDLISAQQEQRRDALEGIREEIRARREQYDDARQATQDARDDARDAFQEQEHQADRAHTAASERIRDQIDALQEQAQASQQIGRSEAQRALEALDAREREYALQQRLNDARRAVGEATTLRGQIDARRTLAGVEHEVAVAHERAALEERIRREREAAETRRQQIAERIAALERQARDEDRAYQRERDARQEAQRQAERAQRISDRNEERTEQARRRQEDAQVRAQEQADREQQRAEQRALQAEERAARAADRADAAQLRAEERAAREADRAAQREILAQQQAIQQQRNAVADANAAAQQAQDVAALQRLRESAALEQQRLAIRERLASEEDTVARAAAARDRVFADEEDRRLALRRAAIEANRQAATDARAAELAGIEADTAAAENRVKQIKADLLDLERRVTEAKDAVKFLNPTGPLLGPPIPPGFVPGAEEAQAAADQAGAGIGQSLIQGFVDFIARDQGAVGTMLDWVNESIIGTVEKALGISSPSTVAAQWAADIAAGFVQGMQQHRREIVDALEDPWIEVDQRFFPEVERAFGRAGSDDADAYVRGFDSERVEREVEECIQRALDRIERDEALFRRAGQRAALQFNEGWCNLLDLRHCFGEQMEEMVRNARAYGTRVGANFTRGFQQTAQVGGAGASQQASGGPTVGDINDALNNGAPRRTVGGVVQVQIGGRWYDALPTNSPFLPNRPLTRQHGGWTPPWRETIVGEGGPERVVFPEPAFVVPNMADLRPAGAVMPANLGARAFAQPAGGYPTTQNNHTSISVGAIHMPVTMAEGDPVAWVKKVGPLVVHEFVAALERAQVTQPRAVAVSVPGALGR